MTDNPFVRRVEFVQSAVWPADYPATGDLPEIAVAGRSNVGKSSLINRFVNRKSLAKVSGTPGRTQLLNFFRVNDAFLLCDLPGYGYAKVAKSVQASWGRMIETYLAEREALRAVLILIDARREPGDWERQLIGSSIGYGRAVVPVITKIDKVGASRRRSTLDALARQLGMAPSKVIGWSSLTGEGLEPLWRVVERLTPPPVGATEQPEGTEG